MHQGGAHKSYLWPCLIASARVTGLFSAINGTQISEQALGRKRKLVLTFLLLSEFKLQRKKSH